MSDDGDARGSPRLSDRTLVRVRDGVARPAYDRAAVTRGIVHIGPGAFHRVHQAWYVDRVLADDPRWAITAVALRRPDVPDALTPQDGLYTLAIRDESPSYQVIGAITECLVAAHDPRAVLARLVDPATRLVTLTVTEKGYCLGADGTLDRAHVDIVHDLAAPDAPRSVIGYLARACALRRERGAPPLIVMSCDNLGDNGARLRRAVADFARPLDAALADHIANAVAFPRTMVDSITPATTDALRDEVAAATGVVDAWPVQREAFTQWVIEDTGGALPDFAGAGATLTDDVAAYDRAKLRLLNGAHSSLAYLGSLLGHDTVAAASADATLAAFIDALMRHEIRATVVAPHGLDLDAYITTIARRFRNPAIRHELAQIAWDGSQKLPVRLFGTIADNVAAGRPIGRLALGVAAWLHFIRRAARDGRAIVDPLASTLAAVARDGDGDPSRDVARFLSLGAVFGAHVRTAPFVAALTDAYAALQRAPLHATLAAAT